MSWAAHNPEKYSEVMREGIRKWLWHFLPDERQSDEAFQDDLEYMLTEMEGDYTSGGAVIFDVLAAHANQEIVDAERAYFESFVP